MLQRLGIRGKILAVVAVPIFVLLLAAGYITYAAVSALGAATNSTLFVDTAHSSQQFQGDLNAERDAGVNFVDSYTDGVSARAASRAAIGTRETALPADIVAELHSLYDNAAAVSLTDARAVGPTGIDVDDVASWPTWPSAEEATAAADAISAVSDAVSAYAADLRGENAEVVKDIAFQLSQEASATQQFLTLPAAFQAEFIEAMDTTDDSFGPFSNRMDEIGVNENNNAVNTQTLLIGEQMDGIGAIRENVRQVSNSASGISATYDRIASSVNELLTRFALGAGDPTLSLQLTSYAAVDELFRQLGLESTFNERILRAQGWGQGEVEAATTQVNQTDFARNEAEAAVAALESDLEVPQWGASRNEFANQDFESVRGAVASGVESELSVIRGVPWVDMVVSEAAAQRPAYDGTIAKAEATSDALRQAALFQTIITAIAAIVVVALSLIIALVIARRIVVPLRRLTTTATAVRAELPRLVERVAIPGESVDVTEVQIPVESRDEVGRLAEAFNGVNAATLAIASEQAALRGSISEMFVNVARRDQVLLNRQLASIDDMERTQDDPDTLTKLFALDHLATRMRRNSESLLVLAGIDTGRRLRRAMPLSDVIRTASSEIELYERVKLELDADPAMLGHSALTAAHLFAELLENATVFSDPGSPVVVRTREVDGNFIVEIQDSGIGMTESELGEANNRVASTAASEILGAQRLGLFVVGRIARRIGARVRIESVEGAGTTAFVTMAPSLFDPSYNADVVHHTETTVNEKLHAPAALVAHTAENEQFDAPVTRPVGAGAYVPSVVEGAPLASRGSDESSVSDLIAADAAAAPAGAAVSGADLTDGVSSIGLPTRRRRESPVEVSAEEQRNVIGLPARATDAQLSALEAAAPSEGFTPAIPASEISPQTPEDRSQMFRGFRSRRDIADEGVMVDPEAESLGHAARRGGLAAEDLLPAQPEPMLVPLLEDDEYAPPVAAAPAPAPVAEVAEPQIQAADAPRPFEFHTPRLEADPRITAGFGDDNPEPFEPAGPVVVPMLELDDEAPVAAAVEQTPVAVPEPTQAPVEQPAYVADQFAAPVEQPAYAVDHFAAAPVDQAPYAEPVSAAPVSQPVQVDQPVPAQEPVVPFGYADVYGSLPAQAPAQTSPWGVNSVSLGDPVAQQEPTLDELIAGATDEEAVKSGFFSRLFGRSKKDKAPEPAAPAAAAPAAQPVFPGVTAPAPQVAPSYDAAPAYEAPPAYSAPAPAYDAPPAYEAPVPTYDAAPAYAAPAPAYDAPPAYEAPAPTYDAAPAYDPAPSAYAAPAPAAPAAPQAQPVSPGGAFALWTQPSQQPAQQDFTPAPIDAPQAGQSFTPDELANPFGWESAGASALAAASPDISTEYHPVLDAQPEVGNPGAEAADMTSAVFSEFSSLAMERPKVEKTRAGLQRRRAADAPAPEVKPIASEVQLSHKDRDADEVRTRFSNFYSGTQRARSDVAEFEQRSQSAVGKE